MELDLMKSMGTDARSNAAADVHTAIKVGVAAAERRDYETGLKVLRAVYAGGIEGAPPDGLSAYGLCLAMAGGKRKEGVDYCQAAIRAQFYESRHYINLIKLYLAAQNRKKAVEVLEQSLKTMPEDKRLLALRNEMGYRARSTIPFLHRDHALNQSLGRLRRRPKALLAIKTALGALVGAVLFLIIFRIVWTSLQ